MKTNNPLQLQNIICSRLLNLSQQCISERVSTYKCFPFSGKKILFNLNKNKKKFFLKSKMKTYIFTILLLLWSVSARAEKGGGSVEDNKEDVSVHELLRYTVQTDVEEFLAIQYAAVDHYMREASFKEINDSSSIDLQHRFFQHGPPFCLQRRNHEIYYDDKNCLYLNIWRRRNSGNKVYPVVVWLVGGLFKEGGAGINKYKVHSLVSKLNVVLVVVQYRIGAGGFFFLNNEYAAGNNGLKDQVLALEWVKRYIQHFKGDKDNIVLVGDE